jgi:hypothetical protein
MLCNCYETCEHFASLLPVVLDDSDCVDGDELKKKYMIKTKDLIRSFSIFNEMTRERELGS